MNEFKIGTQWKTREGHRAIIVSHNDNYEGSTHEFIAARDAGNGYVEFINYTAAGRVHESCIEKNKYDLIEPWKEPVVYEGWVNVYKAADCEMVNFGALHKTKEQADRKKMYRIACIQVKVTAGEGLE